MLCLGKVISRHNCIHSLYHGLFSVAALQHCRHPMFILPTSTQRPTHRHTMLSQLALVTLILYPKYEHFTCMYLLKTCHSDLFSAIQPVYLSRLRAVELSEEIFLPRLGWISAKGYIISESKGLRQRVSLNGCRTREVLKTKV